MRREDAPVQSLPEYLPCGTLISGAWRPVPIGLPICFAEAMAVIFDGRWRHGRIAETWMPVHVGRKAVIDIAARGIDAIVIALLCNRGELGRRRWRCRIDHGGRMRAAGQGERKQDRKSV